MTNRKRKGNCALTGVYGKYIKSHLLPKALTRPEEAGLPFIQSGSGKHSKIRRDSWYDRTLVTKEGEVILSDYDDWAIKELRKQRLIWSGWGPRQTLHGHYSPIPGTPNGIRKIECENPGMLRLFFLSLLWRSSATDLPEFSEVELDNSELEQFQEMLLTKSPKPFDFFPISLIQLSTLGPKHNLSPFISSKSVIDFETGKTFQVPFYRYYLEGLIIHIDIECQQKYGNTAKNPAIVGNNQHILLNTVDYADSYERENLKYVANERLSWPSSFQKPKY